jgi:death on curing protein
MKPPVWVRRDVVFALHDLLLSQHGGLAGIRDQGLLDSALAKPQQLFFYSQPDLLDLAASYAYGVAKNHPFIDGNKRVAFALAVIFLELNGGSFLASEADAVLQTLAMAAGELNEAEYANWLRANTSFHT